MATSIGCGLSRTMKVRTALSPFKKMRLGNILGFDEPFGLTPEQWLVMDYYDDRENEE
jgi:hypothetical protein